MAKSATYIIMNLLCDNIIYIEQMSKSATYIIMNLLCDNIITLLNVFIMYLWDFLEVKLYINGECFQQQTLQSFVTLFHIFNIIWISICLFTCIISV